MESLDYDVQSNDDDLKDCLMKALSLLFFFLFFIKIFAILLKPLSIFDILALFL